jgi:hypothetical protein
MLGNTTMSLNGNKGCDNLTSIPLKYGYYIL